MTGGTLFVYVLGTVGVILLTFGGTGFFVGVVGVGVIVGVVIIDEKVAEIVCPPVMLLNA